MKRRRQRACYHCGVGFVPKPHNHKKQHYCGATECQTVSKPVSQARWRKKNPDYTCGRLAVQRAQEWRAQNPGYWRSKKAPLEKTPLQNNCISQTIDEQLDGATLEEIALRDNCITQLPLILGLMSTLRVLRYFLWKGNVRHLYFWLRQMHFFSFKPPEASIYGF